MNFEKKLTHPPVQREVADFASALEKRGLKVTRRAVRGSGISVACGQLGSLLQP